MALRVAIIPGNGGCDVDHSNWYARVKKDIEGKLGLEVSMKNMPDPIVAHENIWLPFMRDRLHCDERTLVIGHSSGAVAAMRYAETHRVAGIVLVSTYATDLGDETERESGYFSRPWKWDDIRANAGEFVVQFGSTDDPLVPWTAQMDVATSLRTDLRKFEDRGHFMSHSLKEMVNVVQERLSKWTTSASENVLS